MNTYPLDEGVEFKFVCMGCGTQHKTTVPRHSAAFLWRCKAEGCGWTLTVQTDPTGVSAGFQAPLPKKVELHLVRGED